MGKAFESEQITMSCYNTMTTTIQPYHFVKLSCTATQVHSVRLPSTALSAPTLGISQEAINPSTYGRIAISGISRLKVGSTAMTMVVTTANHVAANASGHGIRVAATTTYTQATQLSNAAASDITAVILTPLCAKRKI